MIALQKEGADNIQWLSPTAYVPLLVEALFIAAEEGLTIPIVHKSEGEDPIDDLELLDGLIDMYLPDAKFVTPEFAPMVGLPASYPKRMERCIKEMFRQVGILKRKSDRGRILQGGGLLVRHLLMPNGAEEAKRVLDFIYSIHPDLPARVMLNYEPLREAKNIPGIDRRVTNEEIDAVIHHARTATFEMQVLFG
jgi:putative pyruvate formate lyase activating enzyme